MARDIWVISDTHFGHANIIGYCNRPFDSVEQMDQAMLDAWAETVRPGDIVYHLGDVYLGDLPDIGTLPGRKRLVLGNHDDGKDRKLQAVFERILAWRVLPGLGLLLTHVPVHESMLQGEPAAPLLNLHGHIHDAPSPPGPYRNVCVEWTGYRPINIEDLRIR